jgi:sugar lactone lactonase YvrE
MLSGGTTHIVGVQGGGAQQKTKRARRSFSTTRKVQNVAKRDLEGGLAQSDITPSGPSAPADAPPAANAAPSASGCAIAPVAPTIGSSGAIAATTYATPVVTTYAGTGNPGHLPNIYRPASLTPVTTTPQQQYSVPNTATAFNSPKNICIDSSGNIYISDTGNSVIKVISNGITSLFAGTDAMNEQNGTFSSPRGIVMDFAGENLYVADASCIKKVNVESKSATIFCGNETTTGFIDGNTTTARFDCPSYIDIDSTGNLYVVDSKNSKVRIINSSGVVRTPTWNTNIPCPPICVRCSSNGTLFVAAMNGSIYRITSSGAVSVFSGSGVLGFSDGPSSSSAYNFVSGMVLDSANNLYLADTGNNRVRKVDSTGKSTTIIGNGSAGMKNTDKSADPLQISLNAPNDIAMDRSGNLYVVDTGNNAIRHVAIAPPKADQIVNEITHIHNSIHTDVELLTDPSANPSSIQQGINNIIKGFLRIHSLNIQAMKLYPTFQATLASSVANLEPNMEALTTSGAVGGELLQMGGGPLMLDSTLPDQLQKKKFKDSPLKEGEVPSVVISNNIAEKKKVELAIQKSEENTQAGITIPKFGFYDKWAAGDPSKLHANVDTVMVPLLNNLYAIRKPTVGARENWKRLIFTQAEADFLNDSKVTPGILQEVFSKRYDLTINLIDINSANPVVNSLIQIGEAPNYEILYPKEKPTDTRGRLFLFLEKNISDYFDAKDPLEPGVKARIHDVDPPIIEVRDPPITGKPVRIILQLEFPQAFMQNDDIEGLNYALEGRLNIKPIKITSNVSFSPDSDPSKVSWPVRLADALTKIADGNCRQDYKIAWLNQCRGIKDFIKKIADFHMKNDDRLRLDTLLTINSMKMLTRYGLKTSYSTDPYQYTGVAKLVRAPEMEAFTEGGVDEVDFSVKYNFTAQEYSRNVALKESDGNKPNYSIARLVVPENGLNYKSATELLKKEYAQLLNGNPKWDFYPAS